MNEKYQTNMIPDSTSNILFAEDFDSTLPEIKSFAETEKQSEQKQPIVPTFSFDQVEALKRQVYDDGIRAGQESITGQQNLSAIKTFSLMEQILLNIDADSIIYLNKSFNSISQLLFSTLSALLPNLCARHHPTEIAGLVADIIGTMNHGPILCISVSPETIDQLRVALTTLPPEKSNRIVIAPCADLDPGDVKISWQDGSAFRSTRQAQDAVTAILVALELLPPPLPPPGRFHPFNLTAPSLTVPSRVQQEVETTNG